MKKILNCLHLSLKMKGRVMDFYMGMSLGIGIALLFIILVGIVVEQYIRMEHPFAYATVADFQKKQEGG